jgi:transposase
VKAGVGSYRELSELFDVNKNTIVEWVKLEHESGGVQARKCGPQPQDLGEWRKRIEKLLKDQPDGTLEEWTRGLAITGFQTSPAALCRWCQRLNITLKKKTLRAEEQDKEEVKQKREEFVTWLAEIGARDWVFIDEIGSQLGMSRTYARSLSGERAYGTAIRNRGANLCTIGALSSSGIQASLVFSGATDKAMFLIFIKEVLLPTLKAGQIVVMDNLAAHRVKEVQTLIENVGCTLKFTPPYSPEFNPIEECWSKVKSILRKISARTKESLTAAINTAFSRIAPSDIIGWFNHAGYRIG